MSRLQSHRRKGMFIDIEMTPEKVEPNNLLQVMLHMHSTCILMCMGLGCVGDPVIDFCCLATVKQLELADYEDYRA